MKLIFAQGNPGAEYARTRHNVGWQCLDALADSAAFASKPKFFADIAEISLAGEKCLLVKPQTFYNETGRSLRALVDFYKLSLDDVLIIHDELMLDFGKIRVRHSGRDAGNNGLKSLNTHVGESFARIRVGIATPLRQQMGDTAFVLGTFDADEQALLSHDIIPSITTLVSEFAATSLSDHSLSLVQKEKPLP